MTWELLHGDCRELMADMEGCSIDAIVTDPPYGLSREPDAVEVLTHWLAGDDYQHRGNGFMGNSWDSFVPGPATWSEALRVLKPGGFLLAFFSTRTYDLGTIAIRLAGFEVRDMVDWLFGSGFPKGGLVDGRGACLKPGHEPIVMARKPCVGSARANVVAFGTGKLNIDACRVGESGARNNGRQAGTNGIYGHIGATTPVDYGKGRWPANVIHDGSGEVAALFPTAPGQMADANLDPSRRKSQNVYGAMPAGRSDEPSADSENAGAVGFAMRPGARRLDSGSAARFFYCAKASKADRDEGLDQFAPQAFVQFQTGNGESGAASSLSEGRSTEYRNTHPTVKPEALMRYLVRLVTPEGGTVLDPFTGSGSTGKAAILEGYSFVGCELTAEYLPIAEARLCAAANRFATALLAAAPDPQHALFAEEAA
jgi:site-specific DNA-methyltransferase (adenine-specific)